jgi:hypothetical protein
VETGGRLSRLEWSSTLGTSSKLMLGQVRSLGRRLLAFWGPRRRLHVFATQLVSKIHVRCERRVNVSDIIQVVIVVPYQARSKECGLDSASKSVEILVVGFNSQVCFERHSRKYTSNHRSGYHGFSWEISKDGRLRYIPGPPVC